MQAGERTTAAPAPAWPSLVGIQLVLAALLAGAWWLSGGGPAVEQTPLEAQVMGLEAAPARQALDAALVEARRTGRGLLPADETRTRSYLSLAASAARLRLTGVDFQAEAAGPGPAQVVVARVGVAGDALDLPVFLDGLHRQSALARVDGVAAWVQPGGQAQAWVILRFHRPVLPDAAALQGRVERTVPSAREETRDLLAEAGTVAAWRAFAAEVEGRAQASDTHRQRLLRELPAGLVGAWRHGGRLTWTPTAGLEATANPRP